jgi:hypothetical protein
VEARPSTGAALGTPPEPMAQIFSPSTNTLSKASIVAGALIAGTAAYALTTVNRWPWINNVDVAVE